MTNQLSIANVVTVSVADTPAGLSEFNTSNLALFTSETPDPVFDDGYKIYLEPIEVGTDFGTSSQTYAMALTVFSQQPNILAGGGYLVVITLEPSETLAAAITRTVDLVQYFGIMADTVQSEADMDAAATVVQALNKMAFFVQRDAGSIADGGSLDDLATGGFTHSRGLYYGADTDDEATLMQAAYASRALSVDFDGSNTVITMNLKDLTTILPDPSITQAQKVLAEAAGADVYPSIQGVAKVLSFGANGYFDQIYNLGWLVGAIQVAGFNYLAQSSTKVPQTENGMDGLKGAYRKVCQQGVTNGYVAPGTWNSPNTFGNQADFLRNIAEFGYYIYATPIAQQSQAAREGRAAPLVQIAIKEAGAIHTSSVVIYVNP